MFIVALLVAISYAQTEGYYYAGCGEFGNSNCNEGTVLKDASEVLGVRCVSDQDKSDRNWDNVSACGIWATSDEWSDSNLGCQALTWHEANEFCLSQNGRLPTITELENNCLDNTGCSLDREIIWSSTGTALSIIEPRDGFTFALSFLALFGVGSIIWTVGNFCSRKSQFQMIQSPISET